MKKKFIVLASVLMLVSCGFHLRGIYPNRLLATKWQVDKGTALSLQVKKELRHLKGVEVVDEGAVARIEIKNVHFAREAQSMDRYGEVADYYYTLLVEAQLYYQNQPWGEPIRLMSERYLTYRADSLVVQEEERLLQEEMLKDAAQALVNRLGYLPRPPR